MFLTQIHLGWRSTSSYQNDCHIEYFESTQGNDLSGSRFVGNNISDGMLIEDNIKAPNMNVLRNPQSQDESISFDNSSREL